MLLLLLSGLLVLKRLVCYFSQQFNLHLSAVALGMSLLFFFSIPCSTISAQDMPRTVVGSSGEYLDNLLFGTLNYTVGEIAVDRYQTSMDLAEGFHRAYYDLIVSNDNITPADWDVLVYPNPTAEYLKLELSNYEKLVHAQLYNSTGQLLLEQTDVNHETSFDILAFPAGTYWLRLIDEDGRQASFQIQKVVR